VRLRYKAPGGDNSRLIERPVRIDSVASLDEAGNEFRFAAAVAAFSQLLKGGEYTGNYGYGDVVELAAGARGTDPFGYRGEFLGLVRLADSLSPG
jgi:Ca-activated chloride channel family protein